MEQMNLFGTIEEDNIFVAVDVETTGLSPILNELIEISAIRIIKVNRLSIDSIPQNLKFSPRLTKRSKRANQRS